MIDELAKVIYKEVYPLLIYRRTFQFSNIYNNYINNPISEQVKKVVNANYINQLSNGMLYLMKDIGEDDSYVEVSRVSGLSGIEAKHNICLLGISLRKGTVVKLKTNEATRVVVQVSDLYDTTDAMGELQLASVQFVPPRDAAAYAYVIADVMKEVDYNTRELSYMVQLVPHSYVNMTINYKGPETSNIELLYQYLNTFGIASKSGSVIKLDGKSTSNITEDVADSAKLEYIMSMYLSLCPEEEDE